MSDASRQMTQILVGARRRRVRSGGLVERVKGADLSSDGRRERFNQAVAEVERAAKSGNDVARELAEVALDKVLEEARSASGDMPNVGHGDGPASPAPSFDGGVRGKRRFRPTYGEDPSPSMLFKMAIESSQSSQRSQTRIPPTRESAEAAAHR